MATCVPFQTQVSSILELMVRSAVGEISKLMDEKCAFLHLEISRKQSENDLLKRKLQAMESKSAQLQQDFEKYLERGIALENSCSQTGEEKFPDLLDNSSTLFAIKEESPEEPLWISGPAQNSGSSAVQFQTTTSSEVQTFEKNCHLEQTELSPQKNMDFGHSYNPTHQNMSQNFTIKTEKDENQSGFNQDSCQHSIVKPPQQPANTNGDFSMDERDRQLWSSLMDGNEIESGFPDFSSVVDEYSSTFSEQSEVMSKPGNVPQVHSLCNGVYSNEYPKDAPQSGSFQASFSNTRLQERQTIDGQIANQESSVFTESCFNPQNKMAPTTRGYVCVICGKAFGRLHQFKLHQQNHRKKRAFWCAVCGKSFQCSSHLRIHHRTHTGEKPYGCSVCGKRFTQQSSLRVHQRTHSGERPYICAQCGKTFILMHHLKRHKVIHTNNGPEQL